MSIIIWSQEPFKWTDAFILYVNGDPMVASNLNSYNIKHQKAYRLYYNAVICLWEQEA